MAYDTLCRCQSPGEVALPRAAASVIAPEGLHANADAGDQLVLFARMRPFQRTLDVQLIGRDRIARHCRGVYSVMTGDPEACRLLLVPWQATKFALGECLQHGMQP